MNDDDLMTGDEILTYFSKQYNIPIEKLAEQIQEGVMCGAITAYDEDGNIINYKDFHNG